MFDDQEGCRNRTIMCLRKAPCGTFPTSTFLDPTLFQLLAVTCYVALWRYNHGKSAEGYAFHQRTQLTTATKSHRRELTTAADIHIMNIPHIATSRPRSQVDPLSAPIRHVVPDLYRTDPTKKKKVLHIHIYILYIHTRYHEDCTSRLICPHERDHTDSVEYI